MPYAVLDTGLGGNAYGTIVSVHATCSAAVRAYEQDIAELQRQYPLVPATLMRQVCQLPTPAGGSGEVGERIPIRQLLEG